MFFAVAILPGARAQSQEPVGPTEIRPQASQADHAELEKQAHAKRIFGIVPNYRSTPETEEYAPIPLRSKYSIATQDAFDRGTVALAAAFAGEAMLSNSNPSFGHGGKGYGKYLAASYADYAIGDYLTEAVFPGFLHQDPRYFSRLRGSGMSRLAYSLSRIFVTKGDSGKTQFNYSEILGNATAAGISNLYYRDTRTVSDNLTKLGTQLAVDAASNVLKEFWPDVARKFSRKPKAGEAEVPGKAGAPGK